MGIWSALSKLFGSKNEKRNSITVQDVEIPYPFQLDDNGKMFWFTKDCKVNVYGTRRFPSQGVERKFVMRVTFKEKFMTDGASAPDIFGCVVPHYKEGNDLYNAAPFIHDGLYVHGGEVFGLDKKLSREECDDILREIWKKAGMGRKIRGCADFGIELFAGSSKHWGKSSDDLDCGYLFVAKWEYR
ncbi:MAG: DUF1353 domain-containing protein [Fibrobacter sp.]|nr:DUF1353 domain-containing protein [Fibrobacter sp.]